LRVVTSDYDELTHLHRTIDKYIKSTSKKFIAVFIDKTDQAIKQANAEMPSDCTICLKRDAIEKCAIESKTYDFCISENNCSESCCYGCEVYAGIHSNSNLRIYIDRHYTSPWEHINLWQYLQIALVLASNQIRDDFLGSIKVFYTIRQEAFCCETNLSGEHVEKIHGITQDLYYTTEEHKRIFLDCIRNQDDSLLFNHRVKNIMGREEEAFLGILKLNHPYVKNKHGEHETETIFESIFRHSFDRSRDIQKYGKMLEGCLSELRNIHDVNKREEYVKKRIELFAAKLVYNKDLFNNSKDSSYYKEKMKFLPNYWHSQENFEELLRNIDRNLLFVDDISRICAIINRKKSCTTDDCHQSDCNRHPFSMLRKLGLLGTLKINMSNELPEEQSFLNSREITYINEVHDLFKDKGMVYLIHPALTKSIEKATREGTNILHFNAFIIGKGVEVKPEMIRQLVSDKESMSEKEFLKKYYC